MDANNTHNNQSDPSVKTGKIMMYSAWILLLVFCFVFFTMYENKKSGLYNTKSSMNSDGTVELQIPLSRGNRYEVFGKINELSVKFLIDTGATSIAIPAKIATSANLSKGMPIKSITAGGETTAYMTNIDRLTIGITETDKTNPTANKNIILRDVPATINPSMVDDYILLGMGALKHLEIRQSNKTLILKSQ